MCHHNFIEESEPLREAAIEETDEESEDGEPRREVATAPADD